MRMNKFFRSPKTLWHFAVCGSFGLWLILGALTTNLLSTTIALLQHPRSWRESGRENGQHSGHQSSH